MINDLSIGMGLGAVLGITALILLQLGDAMTYDRLEVMARSQEVITQFNGRKL